MSSKNLIKYKSIRFLLKLIGFDAQECESNPIYSWIKSVFAIFVMTSLLIMESIGAIMNATGETMPV